MSSIHESLVLIIIGLFLIAMTFLVNIVFMILVLINQSNY